MESAQHGDRAISSLHPEMDTPSVESVLLAITGWRNETSPRGRGNAEETAENETVKKNNRAASNSILKGREDMNY